MCAQPGSEFIMDSENRFRNNVCPTIALPGTSGMLDILFSELRSSREALHNDLVLLSSTYQESLSAW